MKTRLFTSRVVPLLEALSDMFEAVENDVFADGDADMGWAPIASGYPESPIEEILAYHLEKYLAGTTRLDLQVKVETICGPFRLDCVVTRLNGRRIGFECDGKGFHDPMRDEWRDAMILGSAGIHTIYRLRGHDLHYRPEDVLYVISRWSRDLFPPRAHEIIARNASEEILEVEANADALRVHVFYREPPEGENRRVGEYLTVERRGRVRRRERWRQLFEFARRRGFTTLDDAIEWWQLTEKSRSK